MPSLLYLVLSLFAALAANASTPDTMEMSCRDVQSLVERSNGWIKLRTGPSIFNSYHSFEGYYRAYVHTADKRSCLIGSTNSGFYESFGEVRIIIPDRTCRESEALVINHEELAANPYAKPQYRVCVNGRWVREYGTVKARGKGSGTSVIGTSFP
jgi:hypothetical protein